MGKPNNLEKLLIPLPQQHFTGILAIEDRNHRQWKLYFYLSEFLLLQTNTTN